MGMVKLMVKEIRKTMVVRVDVVDEDELMMAYSKGQSKSSMVGKSELWGNGGDLYNKATEDGSRKFESDCILVRVLTRNLCLSTNIITHHLHFPSFV